jgi:hypothetical protein
MQGAPGPMTPVREWGDAMMTSLTGALMMFLGAIPRIIAFAVILAVGWFVATLIARGLTAVLRRVDFNGLSERSGFGAFIRRTGAETDPAGAVALTAKWFVRLVTMAVAFDALGLPAVSQVLQRLLLWLPNLVVALVILVVAGLAAGALARVVRGATAQAGFGNPDLMARITTVAIWAFGIVVAVNQIGVASTLVNTLFMGLVGALALAAGLSFGLGGRETAAEIVRGWHQRAQQSAPKIERATEVAASEAGRRRPAA